MKIINLNRQGLYHPAVLPVLQCRALRETKDPFFATQAQCDTSHHSFYAEIVSPLHLLTSCIAHMEVGTENYSCAHCPAQLMNLAHP